MPTAGLTVTHTLVHLILTTGQAGGELKFALWVRKQRPGTQQEAQQQHHGAPCQTGLFPHPLLWRRASGTSLRNSSFTSRSTPSGLGFLRPVPPLPMTSLKPQLLTWAFRGFQNTWHDSRPPAPTVYRCPSSPGIVAVPQA